jgi:hypothetical protein
LRNLELDLKRVGNDNIIWIILPFIERITDLKLKYASINLNALNALFGLKQLSKLCIEEALPLKNDEYDEIEI